jgi:adenylate cyclase
LIHYLKLICFIPDNQDNLYYKMAKETERKFKIKGEFRHLAIKSIEIIQTYLCIDNNKVIRLRIAGDEAYITVKSRSIEGSITRNEWEFSIPVHDAKEMLILSLPGKIVKTRYLIPSGKHIFEVDVFHDKNEGLIIAEIELDSEGDFFETPEWLGEEVTGRPEYYNSNLIK